MGAGISKEQERQAQYRGLQKILRELHKAEVECDYHNKAIHGFGFFVTYDRTLRASNGECFLNLHVWVKGEDYYLLDGRIGVDRIKALFGNERDRLTVTGLAWMIVQIENAVREHCQVEKMGNPELKVFLHNPDGSRFTTKTCTGMEPGQLYAYNEMQDDRPMLRIGPRHDYTEFLPGMSVRWGDGRIIVERKA